MPFDPTLPTQTFEQTASDASATSFTAQDLSDSLAMGLVKETYSVYEFFRAMNHDPRWVGQDALYFGYVPPKNWTGTTIPRANIGQSMVFGKVETAVPALMQSVFYTGGDFFEVLAEDGTSTEDATKWHDIMSYVFEHPNRKFGSTAMPEFLQVIRQMALYGNGGVRLFWNAGTNMPEIEAVDLKDFYIDPATASPSVDDNRSIIERKMMTVKDLRRLIDSDKRFRPVSTEALQALSTITPAVVADTTKRMQSAFQAVNFDPGYYNWIPNPAERKIEVLIYYSEKQIIYVLNRYKLIYNEPNPYGFIPFCFAPFYPVPGRFYAQSVADVIEGFQRYAEALLNGHLDEISLALHPPRQVSQAGLTPANQKWYPGSVMVNDTKDGKNSLLQPQAALINVFTDLNYLGMQSDMVSGITAGAMGVPRPSNANRTAGGVQSQSEASTMRLLPTVLAFEYYLFTPLLYKLYEMIRMHTSTEGTVTARNSAGGTYKVGGDILTKKCNFRMLASTRMLTQERLAQMIPFLLQNLTTGPFVQGLSSAGMTIDWKEFAKMMQEATGIEKAYQIVRPMTPQESQAANQPPPEALMEQENAEKDRQTRLQSDQMRNQTSLQLEQMKQQPKPPDFGAMMMEQQKAKTEEEKARMEVALAAQKLDFDRQAKMMEIEGKRTEMQQKVAAHQIELQQKRDSAQFDAQNSQIKQATMVQEAQQKADTSQKLGEQQISLRQMVAEAKAKEKKPPKTENKRKDK